MHMQASGGLLLGYDLGLSPTFNIADALISSREPCLLAGIARATHVSPTCRHHWRSIGHARISSGDTVRACDGSTATLAPPCPASCSDYSSYETIMLWQVLYPQCFADEAAAASVPICATAEATVILWAFCGAPGWYSILSHHPMHLHCCCSHLIKLQLAHDPAVALPCGSTLCE